MDQEQLQRAARAMPWKHVVKLVKHTVEEHVVPREMPQAILDWFDLNRGERPGGDAQQVLDRMKQASELGIFNFLRDEEERTPIGPTLWIAMHHYLRDSKRWWLLRVWLDGDRELSTGTRDEERRLRKIVSYAGGNPDRLLLTTGVQLFFTWKA